MGSPLKQSDVPVEVAGLTDVVQLTAGHWHSCALRADATVLCWGRNVDGQLGSTSPSTHIPTPVVW